MTIQVQEILTYKDEHHHIFGEPLKDFLLTLNLQHKLEAPHSACWRGYQGRWAIDNRKLYLVEWYGYIMENLEVNLDYLFPDETVVFAKWFTGEITIGIGTPFLDSWPFYQGKIHLHFERGILVKEHEKWLSDEEVEKRLKELDDLPF